MAVPSSGTLSLLGLAKEKVHDDYNSGSSISGQIPFSYLTLGGQGGSQQETYDTTNTNSASYPDNNQPHQMTDWYGYDHDATSTYTQYRTIHYAKPLAACNPGITSVQTWTTASFANGVTVYTDAGVSTTLAAGNYGYHTSNSTSPTSRYTTNASGVVSGLTNC